MLAIIMCTNCLIIVCNADYIGSCLLWISYKSLSSFVCCYKSTLRCDSTEKKEEMSNQLTLFLVATLLVASTSAANNGAITILVNGQPQTKYVLSADWSKGFTHVNGSSITLSGGGRVYLGDSSSGTLTPNSYYQCLFSAKDSPMMST